MWKLRGLGSGKALKLLFYAHNARGRSETTTMRLHTLSRLTVHTGNYIAQPSLGYTGYISV